MENIKAGYMVCVTTWENDADNYKTKVLSGLTKPQAIAVKKFCKFFTSDERNNYTFGNEETVDYEFIKETMDPTDIVLLSQIGSLEGLHSKLIGQWADGYYSRVYESIRFFYFPEDVIEIKL